MKKNEIKGSIVLAVLLIVFSVIALVPPFVKNEAFWCSYVFGVIAIVSQLYFFRTSFKSENAKSRFYGFPIAKIGVIYLGVQLAISFLGMVLSSVFAEIPSWIFIVLDVVILGAAAIGCIAAETARDEIVRQDSESKKETSTIRELQIKIASIANQCEDPELKKGLEALAEELRYSDPVTSEASALIEQDMEREIKDLSTSIDTADYEKASIITKDLKGLILDRNSICVRSK